MTEPKQQTRETPLQQIVTAWHEGLTDPSRRGPRAELRRAKTLEEVVFTPAFHDLRRRLSGTRYGSVSQLALVAGIVAGVDRLDAQPVASRMAERRDPQSESPRVSELRFRRLLQARQHDDLFRAMRRLLGLLKEGSQVSANIGDLAESLYWWNDRTRRRWALDYYDNRPDAGAKGD